MKKFSLFLLIALIASVSTFADNNTFITVNNGSTTYQTHTPSNYTGQNGILGYHPTNYNHTRSSDYVIDNWINERRATVNKAEAGIITRFGYAFNYDAFTYGVSLLYHWDGFLGVTAGFDGYCIPNKIAINNAGDTISLGKGLPIWDARFGLEFGKYFIVGGLLGKSNIDNNNIINMKKNAWFIDNSDNQFMYGGFITLILPISNYFGFNMDFAVTNKTGFNVALGLNVTLPLK